MKNINEAITHCEEVINEKRSEAMRFSENCKGSLKAYGDHKVMECMECAEDHEQLLKWLKDAEKMKELQTPKKPVLVKPIQKNWESEYMCDNCKTGPLFKEYHFKFCPYCGRAIDWSEGKKDNSALFVSPPSIPVKYPKRKRKIEVNR